MNSATTKEDHSVQIHLKLRGGQHGSREERDAIHVISNQISTAVDLANAGELDGDDFGDGEGVLYLYGPDADQLWSVVFPVLKSWELNEGSYAVKRFGPPGSRTETVTF